jgi:hypothetical protein
MAKTKPLPIKNPYQSEQSKRQPTPTITDWSSKGPIKAPVKVPGQAPSA